MFKITIGKKIEYEKRRVCTQEKLIRDGNGERTIISSSSATKLVNWISSRLFMIINSYRPVIAANQSNIFVTKNSL